MISVFFENGHIFNPLFNKIPEKQYKFQIAKLIFNFNFNLKFEDEIALILFSPATHPPNPTEKVVSRLKTTSDAT